MRGRVRLRRDVESALPPETVYERRMEKRKALTRAIDFSIVDENGTEIWVEVADARLLHPSGRQWSFRDVTVREGDLVEILAFKQRVIDSSLPRLDRLEPTRIVLRGSPKTPLLILVHPPEASRLAKPTAARAALPGLDPRGSLGPAFRDTP